jgi:predicted AAA+ superfamily ATPase
LKHLELTDAIIHEYLGNIYHSIIYKDIISRYALRNTHLLEQLIRFIADNVGSLFSAKRISDFLKSQRINMAPNQVQVFAQHLVDAFMVHKLSRYDLIGKRYFEVGDKYYFQDTLALFLTGWFFEIELRLSIKRKRCKHRLTESK